MPANRGGVGHAKRSGPSPASSSPRYTLSSPPSQTTASCQTGIPSEPGTSDTLDCFECFVARNAVDILGGAGAYQPPFRSTD